MRNAGCKGRVKNIKVEGNVYGSNEFECGWIGQAVHLEYFHIKFFCLRALVCVECADADLHQALNEIRLTNASERASVRMRIIFVAVVEIGMRVEMDKT